MEEEGLVDIASENEKNLRKLRERKVELQILVQAIEQNLKRKGYEFQDHGYIPTVPQAGIRIHGGLSFRGRQKCTEMYDRMDEDGDGLVGYDDMRSMRSLSCPLGLVFDANLTTWESWQMAMRDSDITLDANAFIGKKEFADYRALVELKMPLAADLKAAGVGYLPRMQQRWATVKVRVQECLAVRPPDYGLDCDAGKLNLEEVSFILATSGIPHSKHQFKRAMCFISRFDNVMVHLLSRSLRRNLEVELPEGIVGESGGFTGGTLLRPSFAMSREVVSFIKPRGLIAWIFSRRTPPEELPLYTKLLTTKYTMWRWIRRCYSTASYFWQAGMHLRERLVFKQPCIKPPEEVDLTKKTECRLELEIGKQPSGGEDGSNMYWKLSRVDNPADYLTRLGLPKDIGCGIIMDLLREDDVSEVDGIRTCAMLKQELLHHFGEELESSQHFRGLFIFPAVNETDGRHVFRVCLAYKRAISLDSYVKMMGIPYSVDEFVNHFYGELSTSTHLLDIVESSNSSFDSYMYIAGNAFIEFSSEMAISVLEALKVAFSAGHTFETVFNSRITKGLDPDVWSHLRKDFPTIVKYCDDLLLNIRNTKSLHMSFVFDKVSELVAQLAATNPWIRRNFPLKLFTKTGAIPPAFFEGCKKWKKELKAIFFRCRDHLMAKQDAKEAERVRLAAMSDKDRSREAFEKSKMEMLNRLSRLGVEASDKDIYDDESKTPEEYAEDERFKQTEHDVKTYEMFERMKKHTRGFHTCDILLGRSRVSIAFAGADVFELIPVPESIAEVNMQVDEREEQYHRACELDLSGFSLTSEDMKL